MNKIFRNVLLCLSIFSLLFASGCRSFNKEVIESEYERDEFVVMETADSKVEMIFTYAENQSDTYPTTQGAEKFAELVKERTNGRIEIVVKSEGDLGDETSIIEQLSFGGVDFARISLAILAEEIPKLGVFILPFLYKNKEHEQRGLEGEIGQEALDYIGTTRANIVGLSWYDSGVRHFYTVKKPIKTIEDLKGMKIRVQDSELMKSMVRSLGGIPVVMSYDEVYQGLQLGDIDGAENNWPSYESKKHFKVAKYMTETGHSRIPDIQVCSKNVWNKLSSEDREIIKECAAESAKFEKQLWKQRERSSKERTTRNGVEVVEISEEEKEKFKEAVEPLYEQLREDYKELVDEIKALGSE
ncbi:TRAP transporter substrate-binding protein [Clostridium culturomicium]|uniref:TRAP transporter substrate-binding protein n=1 Tax=Clostridium culturomicium TaxID=1499683 RepID=UPI000A69F786|nr:TRAP transporter substrate-binding protein [Clostridium culturomicium]